MPPSPKRRKSRSDPAGAGSAPAIALPSSTPLSALAARHGGHIDPGAEAIAISRIAPVDTAGPNDLAPLLARRYLAAASTSAFGALLVGPSLATSVPEGRRWIHPHPAYALACLLDEVAAFIPWARPVPASPPGPEPHAGFRVQPPANRRFAHIEPGATVDPTAALGPGVVILAGAVVGPGARIEPNAVIYGGAVIGARAVIGAGSVVGRPGFGWTTSPEGATVRVPQLGGVRIEEDAELGPLCTVDAGTLGPTVVGPGAKLDAHVHVGHNASIGPGAIIAAQAGFAGSARIGAGVLVGGQAGVADHVDVGDGARLAAKAGVIGDVPPGAVVAGYPAVDRTRWLKAMARLLQRGSGKRS